MKHPRDWTVATLLDRRITLGMLWRKVRGAVRRGWWWWWASGTEYPFIPDPLRVLPVSTAKPYAGTYTVAYNGEVWGPFQPGERATLTEDPVKRAYDMVAETNRVLTEVFGGPWDLPPDPFDDEDWERLRLGHWTPPDAWDDVIIRGTN